MRLLTSVPLAIGTVILLAASAATAAPELLRNINQSDVGNGSDPRFLAVAHDAVMVVNGGPSLELWRSDGTPGGTTLLTRELFPTTGLLGLLTTTSDAGVGFLAHRSVPGLWRTDGTSTGTERLIADERVDAMAILPEAERLVLLTTADERTFSLRALNLQTGGIETLTTFAPLRLGRPFQATLGRGGGVVTVVVPLPDAPSRDALWVTDGTVGGTRRLDVGDIDVVTGVSEGSPGVFLVRAEGEPLEAGGLDAWVTDGTDEGTGRIGNVVGGGQSASASTSTAFRVVGDRVLFFVVVGDRRELWAVDPGVTTAGASIERLTVADPDNSAFFYIANSLQSLGSLAVFAAETPGEGLEPWITDGTPSGTTMLADLCPGPCGSAPTLGRPGGFTLLGDSLLFGASDGTEIGVWKLGHPSSSSSASVMPFGERCASCLSSRDLSLVSFDVSQALIGSPDGFAISDGTVPGTHSLTSARISSGRTGAARVGERLLLAASDERGPEPWSTDGTVEGTEILLDLLRNDAGSSPSAPLAFAGEVVFSANDGTSSGTWRTDGTTDGTRRLGEDSADDPWTNLFEKRQLGNRLLLVSDTRDGFALWGTGDLDEAPERLTPFSPPPFPIAPPGPLPLSLADAAETARGLVFCQESTLWVTDGTAVGSSALEVAPLSYCRGFTSLGDVAVFRAIEAGTGTMRFWRTDGSLAGTRMVTVPGGAALEGSFSSQVEINGFAVVARLTDPGTEIWSISPDGFASRIGGPFEEILVRVVGVVGDTLLVGVSNGSLGALLGLRLDGQSELLIEPGAGFAGLVRRFENDLPSSVRYVRVHRLGRLAGSVWQTDGTRTGTRFVVEDDQSLGLLSQLDDRLLRSQGGELEVLGGPGFVPVTLATDLSFLAFSSARLVDGVLVFSPADAAGRGNLWRTDGTPSGTFPVTDFDRDPLSARPQVLLPVGDRLLFSAFRRDLGGELWALGRNALEPRVLALRDHDRFAIRVQWRKPNGETGQGTAQRLTSDTGLFYFFRESNVELMIKVLDGRNNNGHFWVFYGALSNLAYEIEVTDTETGAQRVYTNPAGQFGSVGDTRAFAVPGPSAVPAPDAAAVAATFGDLATRPLGPLVGEAGGAKSTGVCANTTGTLCLQQARFEARVEWRKPDGEVGSGVARPLSADTGTFYFFRESNVELVVKVLDGRNNNGHFWVFYGALSNVAYTLTVTDTLTGAVRTYENPQGTFASVGDTRAFAVP